jgi:hypothetical protein
MQTHLQILGELSDMVNLIEEDIEQSAARCRELANMVINVNSNRKIEYQYWLKSLHGEYKLHAKNDKDALKEAEEKVGNFGSENIFSVYREFIKYLE